MRPLNRPFLPQETFPARFKGHHMQILPSSCRMQSALREAHTLQGRFFRASDRVVVCRFCVDALPRVFYEVCVILWSPSYNTSNSYCCKEALVGSSLDSGGWFWLIWANDFSLCWYHVFVCHCSFTAGRVNTEGWMQVRLLPVTFVC